MEDLCTQDAVCEVREADSILMLFDDSQLEEAVTRNLQILEPIAADSGWDLVTILGQIQAWEYIQRAQPDIIVAPTLY
eukprot:1671026-Alexandrium_andersonii.AAC.1